jgi:hypothetical protein
MRKATGLLLAEKSIYPFTRLRVEARMLTGLPKAAGILVSRFFFWGVSNAFKKEFKNRTSPIRNI